MEKLVVNDVEYEMSVDKRDTLLAHGVIRRADPGKHYRLCTLEEMIKDPGSPANYRSALVGIFESLLQLNEDD